MNEHVNGSASADNRASADEGKAFLAENPDIESVDLLIGDLNGVMRGKWAPAEALEKVCQPGINLPLSIFARTNITPSPWSELRKTMPLASSARRT